ncbi:hypothetical protein KXX69_003673 [Aspergillus fumigatus]|nr:hypothetical protein KXX69_003673 [Aspergillus fumigatus]
MASTSHPDAPSEGLVPVPPGALLEDPERIRLVEMIAKKLETVPLTLKISTFKTSYAALWLADIEKLKALADEKPLVIYSLLSVFETDVRLGQRWQQKDNDPESRAPSAPQTPIKDGSPFFPSSSAPGPSPGGSASKPPTSTPQRQPLSLQTSGSPDNSRKRPGEPLGTPEGAKKPRLGGADLDESLFFAKAYRTRDKAVAEACKVRDKACILTGCTREISESCHLFPFSMNDWHTYRWEVFLIGLRMFWCDEKVNEWCKAIYRDVSGTENLQNQILLSPNAHKLHTAGWFALEPIDEDKVHDTRILELQWMMNRVLALRGAAEPEDLEDESDADSEEGLGYLARPVLQSPCLPGQSSPPSSLTNIASDQPKANPIIATTDTVEQGLIEE